MQVDVSILLPEKERMEDVEQGKKGETFGKNKKYQTLYLLHGSYGTSRWWEGFATSLPDEIFSFAPDLRGCGESSKTGS